MSYAAFLNATVDRRGRILFAVSALLLVPAVFFRSIGPIGNWKLTHWLFNYQDEFVKRGLVGELFRLLGSEVTLTQVVVISYAFIVLILGMMVYFFSRPVVRSPEKTGLWWFFLIALTSSATFQHFNYDVGRFDVFCFALALLSLMMIRVGSGRVAAISILACMSLAILVHEAAFFMYVPMVVAYWFYRDPDLKHIAPKVLVAVLLVVVTYFVSTGGLVETKTLTQYFTELQLRYGIWVVEDSLRVLYRGGVEENILMTLQRGFRLEGVLSYLLFAAFVLLPLLILVVKFFRLRGGFDNGRAALIFFASALGPLALYPLGFDHFRWWAATITNFFVIVSLVAYHDAGFRDRLNAVVCGNRPVVLGILLLSLILGPIGVTDSFTVASDYAYLVRKAVLLVGLKVG